LIGGDFTSALGATEAAVATGGKAVSSGIDKHALDGLPTNCRRIGSADNPYNDPARRFATTTGCSIGLSRLIVEAH
jgi:hypothetical protein